MRVRGIRTSSGVPATPGAALDQPSHRPTPEVQTKVVPAAKVVAAPVPKKKVAAPVPKKKTKVESKPKKTKTKKKVWPWRK